MLLNSHIQQWQNEMQEWRHSLHQKPELAFNEYQTASFITQKLQAWNIPFDDQIAETGIVGCISGTADSNSSKKTIALRAEMDALPMEEKNHFAHRSKHNGCFHGCGHDGHVTILLATVRYLIQHKHTFHGNIVFIFQPAEENGHGGAKAILDTHVLDKYEIDEIYALHNHPSLSIGQADVQSGPVMASSDQFELKITGKSCHAASPFRGVDPIVIAAQIILALQTIASRNISAFEPAVISVTTINAGSSHNVIPDSAILTGTVRSFSEKSRVQALKRIKAIAYSTAESMMGQCSVHIHQGYPVLKNNAHCSEKMHLAVTEVLGKKAIPSDLNPHMASEDFSFFLQKIPGCYLLLGQQDESHKEKVHNSTYDFNDRLLPIGSSIFLKLIEQIIGLPSKL